MKLALLVVVGLLLLVVLSVVVIGAMLPKSHTASRTVLIHAPPAEVFAFIDDVRRSSQWRTGLERVEVEGDRYVEISGRDRLPMRVTERVAPRRRVTRIDDASLPFGGTWTWTFEPEAGGTRLTVQEDGEVRNVLFRFVSRFILGHDATLKRVLTDLERAFAQPK